MTECIWQHVQIPFSFGREPNWIQPNFFLANGKTLLFSEQGAGFFFKILVKA